MLGTCDTCFMWHEKYWACKNWRPVDDRTEAQRAVDAATKARLESQERKAAPLWSGCMSYFPLALLAVARLSKKSNEKHNPGEPLGWSREKSNDHLDCAARHLLNPEEIDPEFGEVHAVAVAWRALAVLQLIEEKRLGKTK